MTINEPVFKAFNDFGIDDMLTQVEISRRLPRRLEDIDNAITAGPLTPTARATLESSVFAQANCVAARAHSLKTVDRRAAV